MIPPPSPTPELSRTVPLSRLGAESEHLVEATPAECAVVAARLGIPAVVSLSCAFELRQDERGVNAAGRLRAVVVRECVVSLEPFESAVQENFQIRFVPSDGDREAGDEDPLSIDELPFFGSTIDLGEAAVEQLALALDPYPRRPDAVLADSNLPEPDGHPLAALARLRPNG